MSQAGSLDNGGGGGGGIDIRTITGNNGVPVPPSAGHNFNLIGINGTTVTSVAAPANTLYVDAAGTQYDLATNNATETPFVVGGGRLTLAPSTAMTVTATVVGARDDFTESAWGEIIIGARRGAAGGAVIIGVPAISQGYNVGGGFGARVVGNDIQITVTGEAATDWDWTATIITLVQS